MVIIRTSEISLRFSPLLILTPAAILASKRYKASSLKQNRINNNDAETTSIISDVAWKYTLYTIQKLGPAFIKISQWASSRRDVFPTHICDRLSQLNDSTSLHSWDYTHTILKKSLGDNYEKRLQIDKDDIIGSGSVAQVYSGILWDEDEPNTREGRRVAIKVLHPNIYYLVERDLLLMKRVTDIIDSLPLETIKMLSLPRA